jgi:TetR/AcrR family transcriptional regulator
MTSASAPSSAWVERAVERSAAVQRSRSRIAIQVRQMLDAARTLIEEKGDEFTTQELAAEAGVALQTFYRYFTSKDELLLAVIGDAMSDACERWASIAADFPDPLMRVRFFIVSTLERLDGDARNAAMSRFIVSTRWRLHRYFPGELAEAEQPFIDLLREAIDDAIKAGQLKPKDPEWDSWFLGELVRSVYHFYSFADHDSTQMEMVKEQLWRFSLTALGGDPHDPKGTGQ